MWLQHSLYKYFMTADRENNYYRLQCHFDPDKLCIQNQAALLWVDVAQ